MIMTIQIMMTMTMMHDSSNENSNDNSNESNIVHRCVNRIEQDLVPIYSAGHLARTLN